MDATRQRNGPSTLTWRRDSAGGEDASSGVCMRLKKSMSCALIQKTIANVMALRSSILFLLAACPFSYAESWNAWDDITVTSTLTKTTTICPCDESETHLPSSSSKREPSSSQGWTAWTQHTTSLTSSLSEPSTTSLSVSPSSSASFLSSSTTWESTTSHYYSNTTSPAMSTISVSSTELAYTNTTSSSTYSSTTPVIETITTSTSDEPTSATTVPVISSTTSVMEPTTTTSTSETTSTTTVSMSSSTTSIMEPTTTSSSEATSPTTTAAPVTTSSTTSDCVTSIITVTLSKRSDIDMYKHLQPRFLDEKRTLIAVPVNDCPATTSTSSSTTTTTSSEATSTTTESTTSETTTTSSIVPSPTFCSVSGGVFSSSQSVKFFSRQQPYDIDSCYDLCTPVAGWQSFVWYLVGRTVDFSTGTLSDVHACRCLAGSVSDVTTQAPNGQYTYADKACKAPVATTTTSQTSTIASTTGDSTTITTPEITTTTTTALESTTSTSTLFTTTQATTTTSAACTPIATSVPSSCVEGAVISMNDKNYVYRCDSYYTGNYRYVNPPERSDAVCLSYCVTQSNCLGTSFSPMDGSCVIYTGPGEVVSGGSDDLLIEISIDELPDTVCPSDSSSPVTTSQSTMTSATTTSTTTTSLSTTTTTTQAPIPTCDNLIADPGFELVPTTQYSSSNFATDNWAFSGTQTTVKPYSGTNGDATGFIGFYSGMWYGEAAAVFRPTSHPATGKISQTVRPQLAQAYQLSYNVLPYMVYNDIQSCTITSKYNGVTLDTFVLPKYGGAWEQRSATFVPLEPGVEVSFEVACDHYDGESCGEDPADNCGAFIALDEVVLQLRDPSVCTMQETPLKTYPY